MGRVDESSRGGGNGMRESTIDGGVWVSSISSIEKSRVSLSLTLAIVVSSIAIAVVRSKALSGGVKSLCERVKTSAGAEWDAVVGRVEESGVSLSLCFTLAKGVNIPGSTGDREVDRVHTGSTLETVHMANMAGIRVAKVLSLSGDDGHKGRCYNKRLHDDDTALICRIQLIPM